jgi:hypothetical protein
MASEHSHVATERRQELPRRIQEQPKRAAVKIEKQRGADAAAGAQPGPFADDFERFMRRLTAKAEEHVGSRGACAAEP